MIGENWDVYNPDCVWDSYNPDCVWDSYNPDCVWDSYNPDCVFAKSNSGLFTVNLGSKMMSEIEDEVGNSIRRRPRSSIRISETTLKVIH